MHTHATLILLAATSAYAQIDATATWLWTVTTDDADAIVEPGETAEITLSIDMTPDTNWPDGPVLAFAGAEFDTLAGARAANGSIIDWTVHDPLLELFGDTTTTDGVSLYGTKAAQILLQIFSTDDPIDVLSFTWMPAAYEPYKVEYSTMTQGAFDLNPRPHTAEVHTGTHDTSMIDTWSIEEAHIAFQVVPTPSTPIALITMTYLASPRPSRRDPQR